MYAWALNADSIGRHLIPTCSVLGGVGAAWCTRRSGDEGERERAAKRRRKEKKKHKKKEKKKSRRKDSGSSDSGSSDESS